VSTFRDLYGSFVTLNPHETFPCFRFAHKAKENPAMSGGLALGVGVLAYMAWGLSHRQPGEKLSVYLVLETFFTASMSMKKFITCLTIL